MLQAGNVPVHREPALTNSEGENALVLCRRLIEGFAKKANHNKRESQSCFMLVVVSTAIVPLLITLGQGPWWGKVLPAVLSTLAAIGTSWLQLRKPHQLWALYRGAQRELEDHETKRKYLIEEYESAADPDKLLVRNIAAIALNAHYQWLPMVPDPDALGPAAHTAGSPKPQPRG